MEFTDRGIDPQDSPPAPPIYSYLTDKNLRADSIGSYIGQNHQEFFPDGHLRHLHHLYSLPGQYLRHSLHSPNPRDLHEGIQIELEKEKIREEIMITEAARRRVLEAEVRRELMMERSAILPSGHGFSFRSSPQTDFASTAMIPPRAGAKTDEGSLEERITSLLNGKRESGRFFETQAPIQKGTIVKPVFQAQGDHQKKKYIFLGNPDENVSGLKKKEVTPPRVDTTNVSSETLPFVSNEELGVSEDKPVSEGGHEKTKLLLLAKPGENTSGSKRKSSDFPPSSGGIILHKKKTRENWFCAICHINSTSERAHNDHIQGRKHKWKEEAFRAAKIFSSSTKEHLPDKGTTDDATRPVTLKKCNNVVISGSPVSRKYPFWCVLCQVGTSCEQDMSRHEKGRKHLYRLSRSAEKANREECVAEDGKDVTKGSCDRIVSREFGETENNPEFVETAKPENHSDKISMFVSDEAEDEKDVTNGNPDGITDNEFVNPVKTENLIKGDSHVIMEPEENHELVVEMAKNENHSDNFAMFVSDGAEDGINLTEGDSDGILKPEDNQELGIDDVRNEMKGNSDGIMNNEFVSPEYNQVLVEATKSENHSDKISMFVGDNAEKKKNTVKKGNFIRIMDNEFANSVKSENHSDKIAMLVSADVEDEITKGHFDGIMDNETESNQDLVLETAKSENHSDKKPMLVIDNPEDEKIMVEGNCDVIINRELVIDNAEDDKAVMEGNFNGTINHEFMDPITTEKNQELVVEMEKSEDQSDKKNEMEDSFSGIINHEFMDPIVTEENQELVVETGKAEDHSDNAGDEKIVMEYNFDGIINHEDPIKAEDSQQLVVETVKEKEKSEDHEDEVIDMMEEDDWSAYITELENGVTDGMAVDRGDDGGIMSLVENFVLDADL